MKLKEILPLLFYIICFTEPVSNF